MTFRTPDVEAQNKLIDEYLALFGAFLKAKNRSYGGNALEPDNIFSKAGPVEGINNMIDNKLSRLLRGEAAGEDTPTDLQGYFTLRNVALKMNGDDTAYRKMRDYIREVEMSDQTPASLIPPSTEEIRRKLEENLKKT